MLLHDRVLVGVVVMVLVHHRVMVVMLDDAVGVLDVVMVMVAVNRNAAGADVHVLGERANGGKGPGRRTRRARQS